MSLLMITITLPLASSCLVLWKCGLIIDLVGTQKHCVPCWRTWHEPSSSLGSCSCDSLLSSRSNFSHDDPLYCTWSKWWESCSSFFFAPWSCYCWTCDFLDGAWCMHRLIPSQASSPYIHNYLEKVEHCTFPLFESSPSLASQLLPWALCFLLLWNHHKFLQVHAQWKVGFLESNNG